VISYQLLTEDEEMNNSPNDPEFQKPDVDKKSGKSFTRTVVNTLKAIFAYHLTNEIVKTREYKEFMKNLKGGK
jgi:hypothetical protein